MVKLIPFALFVLTSWAVDHRVTRGDFEKHVILSGELTAAVADKIYAPRTNTWRVQIKWMIDEGTAVQAGEPVIRYDNEGLLDELDEIGLSIVAKLKEMENKQIEGENSIAEAKLVLRTADINHEKAKIEANVPEGLIPMREYQERQLKLEQAAQELKEARDNLKTTQANMEEELAMIQVEIDKRKAQYQQVKTTADAMEIRARVSGVVIYAEFRDENRKVQIGDTVRSSQLVMRIPDLNTLEVKAVVSETDRDQLEIDDRAEMRLDAFPDQVLTGKLLEVSRKGEVREQWGKAAWFPVRLSIDTLNELMRPGMSVRIRVFTEQHPGVLLVPYAAVSLVNGTYSVTRDDGKQLPFEPLAINSFYVAVTPDGPLSEGMRLQ